MSKRIFPSKKKVWEQRLITAKSWFSKIVGDEKEHLFNKYNLDTCIANVLDEVNNTFREFQSSIDNRDRVSTYNGGVNKMFLLNALTIMLPVALAGASTARLEKMLEDLIDDVETINYQLGEKNENSK